MTRTRMTLAMIPGDNGDQCFPLAWVGVEFGEAYAASGAKAAIRDARFAKYFEQGQRFGGETPEGMIDRIAYVEVDKIDGSADTVTRFAAADIVFGNIISSPLFVRSGAQPIN